MLGIILLVLLTFGMSLTFGFAPIDDYHLIMQNLAVRDMSWDGWRLMFTMFDPELYIPFTFFSFKLETMIAGTNPLLFHIDNIVLHCLNVMLVAWIIARLSGSKLAALCAAVIYAIHPLAAETVVWISARKDLLATFLALLSVVFVLKSIDGESRWFWYISVAFFILALLSKISVMLLPTFIALILVRERFAVRSAIFMLTPYVIASVLLGLVAVAGKGSVLASTPLLDRIVLAGFAIALSIGHFFIPANLTLYYVIPTLNIATILIALIPLLLIVAAIFLWKKSPLITVGLTWLFVFILPTVLNIQTDIESSGVIFASDRYVYLPMIGLLLALVGVVFLIRDALDASVSRWSAVIATAIVIVIFIPLTHAQVATWSDADALFSHAVNVSPADIPARIALTETLKKEHKVQDAFNILKDGLAYGDDERLHVEAGALYAAADDTQNAMLEFSKVLSADPRSAAAEDGLAALAAHAGNTDQAKNFYEKAIRSEPSDITAHIALAKMLLNTYDISDSRNQLNAAFAIDPSNIDALQTMAALLRSKGRNAEAQTDLQKAALLQ